MVEKAWNAQMFGFTAVIIIDDDAKDYTDLRQHGFESHLDEVKGQAITIPYYKIYSYDGHKLIDYIKKELPAQTDKLKGDAKRIKWERSSIIINAYTTIGYADQSNRVDYEMWYSSVFDMSV